MSAPEIVVIFGPPAVGKATVGEHLSRLTGYPLFHNHRSAEAVYSVFGYGHPAFETLVGEFRRRVFEEARRHGLPGLIFTYVWSLDDPADREALEGYLGAAGQTLAQTKFAELTCGQEIRLERNRLPERLAAKPSKRNLAESEGFLRRVDLTERLNSGGEFPWSPFHAMVDTATTTPRLAAERLRQALNLPGGD